MDFKEPDLEELIQNDLRTEISKILSQSEIEELEAATSESRDDLNSKKSPFASENNGNSNYHTAMAMKDESSHSEEEQQLRQNEFDVLNSSSLQDISQQNQLSLGHHEISGHFAVGSYADFTREMGHYPVEPNDLQSLTWLTTVDVHALQRLTEQGTVIPREGQPSGQMNQMENPSTSEGQMPVHQSAIQTVPTTHMTTTGNSNDHHTLEAAQNPHQPTNSTHYNMSIHPTSISDGRCYPVNHPRYQIQSHQSGGSLSRNSYENSSHGSRRYMSLGHHHHHHHPYPPPPYNVNRSGYLHGGSFIHPRYHHQGQQPKAYPKPVYSYSCLIAMALYNSKTGCLPVSEIYNFMMENYPYFKTAPDGWKNSVRHNLSLNKCFEKVEKPSGSQRKGCLWALNPAKIAKMKEEVQKWKRKDPESIRRSMSNPEELDRELEEMRRADEEAARRRMLSLTSHGLTAHSVHGHHQHSAHHPNVIPMHPQTSPSRINSGAPVSVPTHQNGNHRCPDLHFSTELAQQNFALTLAKSALQATQDTNEVPYDVQFQGHCGPSNSNVNFGRAPNSDAMLNRHGSSTDMVVLTPGGDKPPHFASPCSASPSSSNTSMLGTFVDCAAGFVGDDELDASLADLAVLHESLWNAPVHSHMTQCGDAGDISESHEKSVNIGHGVSEELPMTSPDGQIRLPPVIRMLSSSQSEQPSPGTPEYKSSSGQRVDNFGRDMSHFSNTSIKPVAMIN